MRLTPKVKLAYQNMNVNLNFPIPGPPTNTFLFDTMDVTVNKAAFWIGSIDCQLDVGRRIWGFLEIGTSLWANSGGRVVTSFRGAAADGSFGSNSWGWSVARPRWWDFNIGASLILSENLKVIGGFKCDNLSERMEVPSGAAYAYFVQPVFQEEYLGDLVAKTSSLYGGLELSDHIWKFRVLWSPWLTSYTVKMPLRVILSDSGGGSAYSGSDSRYELSDKGGQLLEAYGESAVHICDYLSTRLWLKGSWMQCRGNGEEEFENVFIGHPGWEFFSATPGVDTSLATFSRYLWAVGISGQLNF